MSRSEVEQYIKRIISEQPYTPREYRVLELFKLALDKVSIWFCLFGVGVLLAAWYNLLRGSNGDVAADLQFWGTLIVGVGLLFLPFYAVWERYYALKVGETVWASILEVRTTATAARGYWEFRVGQQRVEQQFLLKESWAPSLRPGMNVRILVHPQSKRYLLAVGT